MPVKVVVRKRLIRKWQGNSMSTVTRLLRSGNTSDTDTCTKKYQGEWERKKEREKSDWLTQCKRLLKWLWTHTQMKAKVVALPLWPDDCVEKRKKKRNCRLRKLITLRVNCKQLFIVAPLVRSLTFRWNMKWIKKKNSTSDPLYLLWHGICSNCYTVTKDKCKCANDGYSTRGGEEKRKEKRREGGGNRRKKSDSSFSGSCHRQRE